MGGIGAHRQCVICGIRERHKGKRNLLFASFPLDETRCKQWIRVIGDEDLVSIPIKILRQLRHVCEDHFERRDINKKGTRTKKRAIPKLNLRAAPLTEDQMIDFPIPMGTRALHTENNSPGQHVTEDLSARAVHDRNNATKLEKELIDHDYCKPNDVFRESQPGLEVTTDTSIKNYNHDLGSNMSITKNTELTADDEYDNLGFDDLSTNDDTRGENDKIGNCDVLLDNDDDEDIFPMYDIEAEVPVIPEDSGGDENDHCIPKEHQGFRCNVCLAKIVGFRYRCCECEDYDMCSDCESRQQHPQHYMLRVPGNREQTEIRRVLAAVALSLALPPDLKEELTIKIEDPIHEQPPDPLDTDGADPALLEPVNLKQMDTDSPTNLDASLHACSLICDPASFTARKPRVIPNNKNSTLKIVGADQSATPVVLDALKRKAIVRLNTLALPIQEKAKNPAQRESLHELNRRKEIKHANEQPILQNTRDSSQNIPITIYSDKVDPASTHNIPPKSTSPTIYSPKIGESIKRVHLLQNVIKNTENFFVAEPTEDLMETNGEKVFHMSVEDFNALMAKHDIGIWNNKSLLLYPPVRRK